MSYASVSHLPSVLLGRPNSRPRLGRMLRIFRMDPALQKQQEPKMKTMKKRIGTKEWESFGTPRRCARSA